MLHDEGVGGPSEVCTVTHILRKGRPHLLLRVLRLRLRPLLLLALLGGLLDLLLDRRLHNTGRTKAVKKCDIISTKH